MKKLPWRPAGCAAYFLLLITLLWADPFKHFFDYMLNRQLLGASQSYAKGRMVGSAQAHLERARELAGLYRARGEQRMARAHEDNAAFWAKTLKRYLAKGWVIDIQDQIRTNDLLYEVEREVHQGGEDADTNGQ